MICGKIAAGKSVLSLNLVKYLTETYEYRNIVLFSNTFGYENENKFSFIDKENVFHSKDIDIVIPKLIDY